MSKGNVSVRLIERLMLGIIVLFVFGPMSAQTKRALVIGISEYAKQGNNSWSSIHGANDADLLIPVLKAQGFKTTKVCNKSAIATKIRREISRLTDSSMPGDIVYLHFSCHGQPSLLNSALRLSAISFSSAFIRSTMLSTGSGG